MQTNYLPVREDWLKQHAEEILDPSLPIVDAHHHFYDRPGWQYLQDDYLADASAGHAVEASVYMQALTHYRSDGPESMKPVGETDYVVKLTEGSSLGKVRVALGIVGHADLSLGVEVAAVLDAHVVAGRGRFKGIRHLTTWDADSSLANPLTAAPRHLLLDPGFRQGFGQLARAGLSFDAWLFWPQLPELLALARAFPDTVIVIDHCGGVVRTGAYQGSAAEDFQRWRASMTELAAQPNAHVKLGGLGMRINGFNFHSQPLPPTSRQLADAWKPWIESCIEAFGVERCMFESNFPVDKGSYSFATGWNAFKHLTAGYSPHERQLLFAGTARRVYRLECPDISRLETD